MTENWKPVVGFEGLYEVSDQGRVRSLDHEVEASDYRRTSYVRTIRGRMLKLSSYPRGHLYVSLHRGEHTKKMQVHRLVLEAFRGSCPPGHQCCHWDDDPTNNRLDNLRWGTPRDNNLDMVRNGNHNNARKTHCPRGHEYTVENTRLYRGRRNCRTCQRASSQAYKARKVAS